MIQLQEHYLTAVRDAASPAELRDSVQHAIELEFATLPPYLTAVMSLEDGKNDEISHVVDTVIRDEMLHMLLDCNMLVALGGKPAIASTQFVPTYPSPLPMCVDSGLIVGLERLSIDLVQHTFMGIEQPEDPLHFPAAAEAVSFATIGAFYAALNDKLTEFGDSAFNADPSGQLLHGVNPSGSGSDLSPIVDVASASKAIELIVREGEGTRTTPLDTAGDVAHYYRFEQLVHGKTLIADPTVAQGFSFTGDPIPFDPDGVFPITPNQRLADLDAHSEAGQQARKFAGLFTQPLTALQKSFAGQPTEFPSAVGLMFDLLDAGKKLCAIEVVVDGQPTGRNAGPTWKFLPANR
jgi:hypothetical protein